MKDALKIGVSGVRGIVGDSFTPQLAASFAQAFGTLAGRGALWIGRDTRPSGVMVEQAVVAGLLSVGCKPVRAGTIPTPSLLHAVSRESGRGGIMITASHNAEEWNALKFVDRRGLFLDEVHTEELLDIYHQKEFPYVAESDVQAIREVSGVVVPQHFDRIAAHVEINEIRKQRFRVAIDCCNGVGAIWSRPFLEQVCGCDVIALHEDPTGLFERPPEPLPAHLDRLAEAVREHHCVLGFAQDPDGDRLAVVDESGCPVGEEVTVTLAAQAELSLRGPGPLVANLSAGKRIENLARREGVPLIRTATGEVHVTSEVLRQEARVGVEHTGGIIIPAIHPCRDSYAGMALILELLTRSGRTISSLSSDFGQWQLVKDSVIIQSDEAPALLREIRQGFAGAGITSLDGLFIDFGNRWLHVRRSNTEPVLRIIAEAQTREESVALIAMVRKITG